MWVALAHTAVAFFGFYAWLRSQKIVPLWSELGALSFAGSGHLISCWNNLPFIATAAWIPWVFWAAQKALEKPSLNRWILLGIILSLQILAGYPFFTFYTIILLVLWFECKKPPSFTRLAFWLTLSVSACATAIQWIPFLDFLSYGYLEPWKNFPYFDNLREYGTLIKPDFLGFFGSSDYRGTYANANFNLYFGLIPLGLCIASLFFTQRAQSLFWVLSAGVLLIWMAGRHLFVWNFIPDAMIQFLEPSKSTGIFLFCAITAVVLTIQHLFQKNKKIKLLWIGFIAFFWLLDIFRVPFLLSYPMPNPFQNPEIQKKSEQMKIRLGDSRMLTVRTAGDAEFSGPNAFQDSFESPIRLLVANSNSVWGIRSADSYLTLHVDGAMNLKWYELTQWPYSGDLLDIAGVRFILAPQGLPSPKFKRLDQWENHFLFQNTRASEDMRFVSENREWDNRPAVLNQLTLPKNPWEKTVYLEKDKNGGLVHLPPAGRWLNPLMPSGYQRPSASRASFSFHCSQAGYVVFNETYAPGWRAWVDGRPVPILRAYGLFMAAPISDKGDHQLAYRYEPASFRLGLFISLVSLGLVGFFWGVRRPTSQLS